MNQTQQIAKNIISLTSSIVLFAVSVFIFNILVARHVGDVEFGKYSFAIAFTSLFVVISGLGLDIIVARDVTLDKSQVGRYFSNVFFLQIILSIITFLLIVLVINITPHAPDVKVIVYIISIAAISTTFIGLSRAIYRAFEKMEWDIIVTAAGSILLLGVGIPALRLGYGIIEISCILSAVNLLMILLGSFIVVKRFAGLNLKLELRFFRQLLINAIPFALNAFLWPVYQRTDIVMLSFLKNDAAVGWYNAASILSMTPLLYIATGFARALFPTIARTFVSDTATYTALFERAVRYSIAFLVPLGVGMTLLADVMVAIVFGPQFANSAAILKLLIWAGILFFMNYLYMNVMEATGKQRKVTLLLGTGAAANIVLNFLLIPQYSVIGAAVATLISQFACLIAACFTIGHINMMKILAYSAIRPVLASIPMGVFVIFLSDLHIIPLVIAGAAIYFLALYILGGITREDRRMFMDLINSSKMRR